VNDFNVRHQPHNNNSIPFRSLLVSAYITFRPRQHQITICAHIIFADWRWQILADCSKTEFWVLASEGGVTGSAICFVGSEVWVEKSTIMISESFHCYRQKGHAPRNLVTCPIHTDTDSIWVMMIVWKIIRTVLCCVRQLSTMIRTREQFLTLTCG